MSCSETSPPHRSESCFGLNGSPASRMIEMRSGCDSALRSAGSSVSRAIYVIRGVAMSEHRTGRFGANGTSFPAYATEVAHVDHPEHFVSSGRQRCPQMEHCVGTVRMPPLGVVRG